MLKKINKQIVSIFFVMFMISYWGCDDKEQINLFVNPKTLEFSQEESGTKMVINTNALQWDISISAEWLQVNKTMGGSGNTVVNVTASENPDNEPRSAIITVTTGSSLAVQIPVSQESGLYPSYNTSRIEHDPTGMSSNANALAGKIKLGWNIGNSLEAIGGETAWGNPRITNNLIDLVKQNGFNAVRIPCSWNQYMANSSTALLRSDWLARVKEVVQCCIDKDMYVLLNIHWDGGWLENNCTVSKQRENKAKLKAFWEQIATNLRDFDEHLIFAGANEPNVENAEQMTVLNSYHQTFINAVRATGGKNAYRVLVIQGPSTDIGKTNELMLSLPSDKIPNRIMVEVHYYTPWNFCGMSEDASWGYMFYYWGEGYHSSTDIIHNATWGEEETVNANFNKMKVQFVDKGIPVVLGEYSVLRRSDLTGEVLNRHLASRAYYLMYVTRQAKAKGLLPFYWDNGWTGNNGCAIFNRNTNTVFDQQALTALIQGATE